MAPGCRCGTNGRGGSARCACQHPMGSPRPGRLMSVAKRRVGNGGVPAPAGRCRSAALLHGRIAPNIRARLAKLFIRSNLDFGTRQSSETGARGLKPKAIPLGIRTRKQNHSFNSFPGSAGERTSREAPPRERNRDEWNGRYDDEAEPRQYCVPRQSLGTRKTKLKHQQANHESHYHLRRLWSKAFRAGEFGWAAGALPEVSSAHRCAGRSAGA